MGSEKVKFKYIAYFFVLGIFIGLLIGIIIFQIRENTNNSNIFNDSNLSEQKEKVEIQDILTPAGFSGSSFKRVILYRDKTVYVVNYDGMGFEESNIISKELIAKGAEKLEYDGQGENFRAIIIVGKNVEIIDNSLDWIEFNR